MSCREFAAPIPGEIRNATPSNTARCAQTRSPSYGDLRPLLRPAASQRLVQDRPGGVELRRSPPGEFRQFQSRQRPYPVRHQRFRRIGARSRNMGAGALRHQRPDRRRHPGRARGEGAAARPDVPRCLGRRTHGGQGVRTGARHCHGARERPAGHAARPQARCVPGFAHIRAQWQAGSACGRPVRVSRRVQRTGARGSFNTRFRNPTLSYLTGERLLVLYGGN